MRAAQPRGGYTLIETIVALVVFAALISVTLSLSLNQVRAFTAGTDRSELTLAGNFASGMLARQVRAAGTNTVGAQPYLVYADSAVLAFHADLVSRIADPFAVYIDPDAPSDIVLTLPRAQRYTLPRTSFTYPDSTYWAAPGILSPAELVIFYFEPDTTTARADDFVLMRRVNAAAPEVVTRNVLRSGTEPFFRYFRLLADTAAQLQVVPPAQLPLRHSVPIHLSAADTGAAAVIDSVRAVRFSFTVTNGRVGAEERRLQHSDMVWLRNVGLSPHHSCGSPPIFSSAVTATPEIIDGAPAVRIVWDAALDEGAGEEDVIRYVLWRRLPAGTLGDPLLSVPAGSSTYEYLDTNVQSGETWIYAVAAQDCTPAMSAPISSVQVIVPTP